MSYIRSLSNPEGLYIWGETRDVMIACNGELYSMPTDVFHQLLGRWKRYMGTRPVKYMGGRLEEVKVRKGANNKDSYDYKWRLSYNDWHIDMWTVTLHYIAF